MLIKAKQMLGSIPIVGPTLKKAYSFLPGRPSLVFERSDQYWEDRYKLGGTSGSGSYGRLAAFKADFLNALVREHEISSVVEFGCGDGAQLQLAKYPIYTGFDVSPKAIEICTTKFEGNTTYDFYLVGSRNFYEFDTADLALSLDVIYHLIEDDVFETYMGKLFASAERFVVIYAYDFDKIYSSRHERGRKFTGWIDVHAQDWTLMQKVPNPYPHDPSDPNNTSQSDFFVYIRRG